MPAEHIRHIRTWVDNLEKYGTLATRRAPGAKIKLPKCDPKPKCDPTPSCGPVEPPNEP